MDDTQKVMNQIYKSHLMGRIKFDTTFLNNVAMIFLKRGFGVTEAYLLEKSARKDMKEQSEKLLGVLTELGKSSYIRNDRAIGSQIIKILNTLKEEKDNAKS